MVLETEPAPAQSEAIAVKRRRMPASLSARAIAERWSLLVAFAGAFAFFSIAKPAVFLTWANAQAILDDASVLCILAVGATVVLVLGEFDLSIGAVVGLASASSVAAMSYSGWSTGAAIAIG